REALAAAGIEVKSPSGPASSDFSPFTRFYTAENQVAEHVSPPLAEEIKVTLKVSQNLHAGMGPYLLGALVAKDTKNPLDAGFHVEHDFLQAAKLDLSGAGQGDGAGGDWADLFSPDFMVHYLTYWTTRPDYQVFFNALPILGKDGTLAKIQTNSPGAGHVFAKTGTFGSEDKLNGMMMLNGKGLAVSGDRLAAIGDLREAHAKREIDAKGRIVAPGFIDMLGQSVALCLAESEKLETLDVPTADFSHIHKRKQEYSAKVRKALKR